MIARILVTFLLLINFERNISFQYGRKAQFVLRRTNKHIPLGKFQSKFSQDDNFHFKTLNKRISLDSSVVPDDFFFNSWNIIKIATVIASIFTVVNKTLGTVGNENEVLRGLNVDKRRMMAVFAERIKKIQNKMFNLPSLIKIRSIFPQRSIREWNTGILHYSEALNSHYAKYRFNCDVSASGDFDEVLLCWSDEQGRLHKKPFATLDTIAADIAGIRRTSPRRYFEVVDCISDSRPAGALRSMALGVDRSVAFKPTTSTLRYSSVTPIHGLTIVASGTGVVKALGTAAKILSDPNNLTDVAFVWVNERAENFILSTEVEALEARHPTRLRVSRVLCDALDGGRKLGELVVAHEVGRVVAVLSGSEGPLADVQELLREKGYSPDSILASL